MGCLLCCFRNPKTDEEPSALIKASDDSPTQSPRKKSYGALATTEYITPAEPSPPKPPRELLYSENPQSARVRAQSPTLSPKEVKVNIGEGDEAAISSRQRLPSPVPPSSPVPSPTPDGAEGAAGGNGVSNGSNSASESPTKMTLAQLASLAKHTSSFPRDGASRTDTRSPSPAVSKETGTKQTTDEALQTELAKKESRRTSSKKSSKKSREPSPLPEFEKPIIRDRNQSFDSDTCHSIGEVTGDEESEDTKILSPVTPVSTSLGSASSESRLITSSPSPGSSTVDISKDSTGKKHSKAKDFMKKAGKNVKKATKKVGKGMEKMLAHDKKKDAKDESGSERSLPVDTSSGSQTPHETPGQSGPPKRVTSDRMKSKYARDRLAAIEKKREEEASHRAAQGMADPRQAAMERGEKLSELEDKTEHMREQAAAFAHNMSQLKNRSTSSS